MTCTTSSTWRRWMGRKCSSIPSKMIAFYRRHDASNEIMLLLPHLSPSAVAAAAAAATAAVSITPPDSSTPPTTSQSSQPSSVEAKTRASSDAAMCPVALGYRARLEGAEILCDRPFLEGLRTYVDEALCEDSAAVRSGGTPTNLQALVLEASRELETSLSKFSRRLAALRTLMASATDAVAQDDELVTHSLGRSQLSAQLLASTVPARLPSANSSPEEGVAELCDMLQYARDLLLRTQTAVVSAYCEKPCPHAAPGQSAGASGSSSSSSVSSLHKFDAVRVRMSNERARVRIDVDVAQGTVTVIKKSAAYASTRPCFRTYHHSQIITVTKPSKPKCSVALTLAQKPMARVFKFSDMQSRDLFCVLLERTKMLNANTVPVAQYPLSVFIGSWNMGNAEAPADLSSWLNVGAPNSPSKQHDLYIVGTQESYGTMGAWERDWMASVRRHIGNYDLVACESLWQIRIAVLVRPEISHRIWGLQQATVATGIANALGNKGAVAVAFNFDQSRLCFINSHLASGGENCVRRAANYHEIIRGLTPVLCSRRPADLLSQFDHLLWFGDLNYRMDLTVDRVLELIDRRDWNGLRNGDQLLSEQRNGRAFVGFEEGKINFAPTYRFERGTRTTYNWRKGQRVNVPSWCDRVLWRSAAGAGIALLHLGAPNDIVTSDHSPVMALFELDVCARHRTLRPSAVPSSTLSASLNPNALALGAGCASALINHVICISNAIAKIRAPSATPTTRFVLETTSACLSEPQKSRPNRLSAADRKVPSVIDSLAASPTSAVAAVAAVAQMSDPMWTRSDISPMNITVGERNFVEAQHLTLAVYAENQPDQALGVATISLRLLFGDSPFPFSVVLTLKGETVGSLVGAIHVTEKEDELRAQMSGRSRSIIPDTVPNPFAPDPKRPDDDGGAPLPNALERRAIGAKQRSHSLADVVTLGEMRQRGRQISGARAPTLSFVGDSADGLVIPGVGGDGPLSPRMGDGPVSPRLGDTAPQSGSFSQDDPFGGSARSEGSAIASVPPRSPRIQRQVSMDDLLLSSDAQTTPTPTLELRYGALDGPAGLVSECLCAHGLGELVRTFIGAGYDDRSVLVHVGEDDLDAMGVTETVMRAKVLEMVRKLKENESSV
eukprot:Opistho-2@86633